MNFLLDTDINKSLSTTATSCGLFSRWPTSADGSMSRGHWSRRPGVRLDFLLEASPSYAQRATVDDLAARGAT